MSAVGQTRRFADVRVTSAYPLTASDLQESQYGAPGQERTPRMHGTCAFITLERFIAKSGPTLTSLLTPES
jgi:hypothetical protein